jgi:hypothetical protein
MVPDGAAQHTHELGAELEPCQGQGAQAEQVSIFTGVVLLRASDFGTFSGKTREGSVLSRTPSCAGGVVQVLECLPLSSNCSTTEKKRNKERKKKKDTHIPCFFCQTEIEVSVGHLFGFT